MRTQIPLELPPLQPFTEVEPHLTFEQYGESAGRLEAEQGVTSNTIGLWLRLRAAEIDRFSSSSRFLTSSIVTDGYRRTNRERMTGSTVDATQLYGVLEVIHNAAHQQADDINNSNSVYTRERGSIGIVLPKQGAGVFMPKLLGLKGLVVATYAVNDHIARGKN